MAVRIYGNRPIKTLAGRDTRPTAARVREAVFNIWQGRIEGCHWLDLCAGSGAMGAEALCRGATRVIGIEKAAKSCAVIQHNWATVASPQQSFRVIRGDVVQQLETLRGQMFDLIYLDPPYASGLYIPVLEAIATHHLLADDGELAAEHDTAHPLPDIIPPKPPADPIDPSQDMGITSGLTLTCDRQKTYGSTRLSFYSYSHTA